MSLPQNELSSSWHCRQDLLTRTLSATYQYSCRHSGSQTRTFVWRAEFNSLNRHLILRGLQNIDGWGPLLNHDHEFSAFWWHEYCEHLGDRICLYDIHGYVEGEVTPNGILMDLVRVSTIDLIQPKVVEECIFVNAGANHQQCPVQASEQWSACHISSIDIRLGF